MSDKVRRAELALYAASCTLARVRTRSAKARDAMLSARREVRASAELMDSAAGDVAAAVHHLRELRHEGRPVPAKGPTS